MYFGVVGPMINCYDVYGGLAVLCPKYFVVLSVCFCVNYDISVPNLNT